MNRMGTAGDAIVMSTIYGDFVFEDTDEGVLIRFLGDKHDEKNFRLARQDLRSIMRKAFGVDW